MDGEETCRGGVSAPGKSSLVRRQDLEFHLYTQILDLGPQRMLSP